MLHLSPQSAHQTLLLRRPSTCTNHRSSRSFLPLHVFAAVGLALELSLSWEPTLRSEPLVLAQQEPRSHSPAAPVQVLKERVLEEQMKERVLKEQMKERVLEELPPRAQTEAPAGAAEATECLLAAT